MDLSDFTSAENKKMTTENDIPTFNPPIGGAPKVGVDGKSFLRSAWSRTASALP